MTTAPRAARQRRICMLVYGDTPTGLPPMVNLGVSLVAAGFDVELICLAHATPAKAEVPVPGVRITRLHVHSRRFFHAVFGKATALRGLAAVQYVVSYLEFVTKAVASRRTIHGYEVDDVSRAYIEQRGFGPYFLHRTGHSIGYEVHGNGVNIDNLETRDQRTIIPGVCFSIEPGVYLPEFGVRSEIDMFVGEGRAEVTGDIQRELLLLA